MGEVINITAMVKKLENPPNRIREQRQARKLSLQFVADALNTTPTVVGRYETGERPITLHTLRLIARALKTNVGQLLNADDNPDSLNDQETVVIDAMRHGEPHVAEAVVRVAESLREMHVEPERRRA